jgi:hypothetical protein
MTPVFASDRKEILNARMAAIGENSMEWRRR